MSDQDIEKKGLEWQDRLDEFLVGYVSDGTRPEKFHTPAIVVWQRRRLVAIRAFNHQTTRQTGWMMALTVAIGIIASLQLWAMLMRGGA